MYCLLERQRPGNGDNLRLHVLNPSYERGLIQRTLCSLLSLYSNSNARLAWHMPCTNMPCTKRLDIGVLVTNEKEDHVMFKCIVAPKTLTMSIALLLTASLAPGAETKGEREAKVSRDDANFMKEAAAGGLAEVQLGKIAADKASSKQVKDFGQRMQKDHGKANEALKKLAANKGVQLPTKLEGKHKSTVDRLSKLSGDEFDREYMRAMVEDHKETLEKFQREADKGKDPDVQKFASEHVPILKKHFELAQTTQQQVADAGKSAAPGKSAK